METPFAPFNNPSYIAPNLTTLTFEGVVGSEIGFHPNFAPKLDFVSLTDAAGMDLPDLANLKRLDVIKTPFHILPTSRNWSDIDNVENLSISLPVNDATSGVFPSLKALQIYRSINDLLVACLEGAAEHNRRKESQPRRLEYLTVRDISAYAILKMSEGIYFTNVRVFVFLISPVTKKNRDFIFHGVSRRKYVKALATFLWHCAEDTQIIGGTPPAEILLAEARRLNENEG
jgi:hypothetical protein